MFELIEGIVYIHTYIHILCTWKHRGALSCHVSLQKHFQNVWQGAHSPQTLLPTTTTKLKSAKLNLYSQSSFLLFPRIFKTWMKKLMTSWYKFMAARM